MKLALILAICCGMTLAGCKSKKDAPESAEKTKDASNLVEMSVSAQKHIGMVVAPAAVSQLNEYLRTTGTVQPIVELFVGGVNVYMGKRAVSASSGD